MIAIIDRMKSLWHEDIVSDPIVHGWVLNLYRAGERYPQTVDDYFPSEHAPSDELAEDLRRHARDEYRHEQMYTAAIRALGQPVLQMCEGDVFNAVIRRSTPVSFRIRVGEARDEKRRKIAHFLAHAHFLEKRIARSLSYHHEACEKAGQRLASRLVSAVLGDEDRHVRYTRDWIYELLPRRDADAALDVHRKAEARANLEFSQEQVHNYLRLFRRTPQIRHAGLYRFCAWMMQEGARLA